MAAKKDAKKETKTVELEKIETKVVNEIVEVTLVNHNGEDQLVYAGGVPVLFVGGKANVPNEHAEVLKSLGLV